MRTEDGRKPAVLLSLVKMRMFPVGQPNHYDLEPPLRGPIDMRAPLALYVGLLLGPSCIHSQASIRVGANVQVSLANANLTHDEMLIAADPTNAQRLIACSFIMDPAVRANETNPYTWLAIQRVGTYVSQDAGASWTPGVMESGYNNDPACAFAPNGNALFTGFLERRDTTRAGLSRVITLFGRYSDDGGRSWHASAFESVGEMSGVPFGVDRDFITSDVSPTSPYRGRVYLSSWLDARDLDFNEIGGLGLFRSLDNGRTYERPTVIVPNQKHKDIQITNGTVLSDGTVIVLFEEGNFSVPHEGDAAKKADATLRVVRSRDGGTTLDRATTVATIVKDQRLSAAGIIAYVATDPGSSAFRDRVYVVWSDSRSGHNVITLSYSTDKGATWSDPRPIANESLGLDSANVFDMVMPQIAVNKTGVVGIMWYDRRENPKSDAYVARFSASLDGGESWLPSVRVSTATRTTNDPKDLVVIRGAYVQQAAGSGPIRFSTYPTDWLLGGHTSGLAAAVDGRFHALWMDNRTGVHQLWTAAITVDGLAASVDTALAGLVDVSTSVHAMTTTPRYDPKTNDITVEVELRNISTQRLAGPMRLRLSNLKSNAGIPRLTAPLAAVAWGAAVVDLSDVIPADGLAPQALSSRKHLVFHIVDAKLHSGSDVLAFDARVFAKAGR